MPIARLAAARAAIEAERGASDDLIDRFGVSVASSQLMLFVIFMPSAAGVLLGGLVGDRIGRCRICSYRPAAVGVLTILLPRLPARG